MEISSSGAGSVGQGAPTQTGSIQQVNRTEPKVEVEAQAPQENRPPPAPDQRVGTVVDVTV